MSETRRLTTADLRPIGPPEAAKAVQPQKHLKAKKRNAMPPAPPGELTAAQRARRRRRKGRQRAKVTPWPTIQAMLIELQQRYPDMFGAWRKPLAIGIHADIVADLGCDKYVLKAALQQWTTTVQYLAGMVRATHRYALDGTPAAELTDAERARAKERLPEARERDAAAKAARANRPPRAAAA